MKKSIAFSMAILILLSVSSCGVKPFEGEICELEFKEAYTQIVPIPVTIFNGKTSTVIIVPVVHRYPDRWYVKVKTYDSSRQEFIYNECYVTEECFDTLEIGDWFVYNEDYCFDEEPCVKYKSDAETEP